MLKDAAVVKLFFVLASGLQLVEQRSWNVLSQLSDGAYKISLAAKWKRVVHELVAELYIFNHVSNAIYKMC